MTCTHRCWLASIYGHLCACMCRHFAPAGQLADICLPPSTGNPAHRPTAAAALRIWSGSLPQRSQQVPRLAMQALCILHTGGCTSLVAANGPGPRFRVQSGQQPLRGLQARRVDDGGLDGRAAGAPRQGDPAGCVGEGSNWERAAAAAAAGGSTVAAATVAPLGAGLACWHSAGFLKSSERAQFCGKRVRSGEGSAGPPLPPPPVCGPQLSMHAFHAHLACAESASRSTARAQAKVGRPIARVACLCLSTSLQSLVHTREMALNGASGPILAPAEGSHPARPGMHARRTDSCPADWHLAATWRWAGELKAVQCRVGSKCD